MPLDLSTLQSLTPHGQKLAFTRLLQFVNGLEGSIQSVQDQVGKIPAVPTMADIQKALGANGSNPLNLEALVGSPAAVSTQTITIAPPGVPLPPVPPPGIDDPTIPHPPVTPPPTHPGTGGGDSIPVGSITVVNSPPLAPMLSTAVMTRLQIDQTGFAPEFTTQATWPNVTPPGWSGPLEFTLWMVVQIAGVWYGSGVVQFWRGLTVSGGPPQYVGAPNPVSGSPDWFYSAAWGVMQNYQPTVGETVGMLVTAGNQRQGANDHTVAERSNIVTILYPPASGAVYTWALPA